MAIGGEGVMVYCDWRFSSTRYIEKRTREKVFFATKVRTECSHIRV